MIFYTNALVRIVHAGGTRYLIGRTHARRVR
jgi:hypothetical protein